MFFELPALLKVLACIAGVVAVSRVGVHLSIALAGGTCLMGWWMGMDLSGLALAWARALSSPQTLSLIALVTLILWLSGLMKESNQLTRIVESFGRLVKNPKAAAVVMPALIGLLPMPGGALFSAPMVAGCCQLPEGGKGSGEGALLTAINYWFRHHAELWWPLYPAVILALTLSGLPTWLFVTAMFPLMIVHLLVGWIFLMPLVPKTEGEGQAPVRQPGSLAEFMREVMPVTIVVGSLPVITVGLELAVAAGMPQPSFRGMPLMVGLAAAVAWTIAVNRIPGKRIIGCMLNREGWAVPMMVVAVMGFKGILTDSGAVKAISAEFVAMGAPTLALIVLLPFVAGFVTGIGVGFVAASFPLITPLFPTGDATALLAVTGLAFGAGYLGQMTSPIHLCLVVTKEFFQADYGPCYRRLAAPLACMAAAIALWFLLVHNL